MIEAGLVKVASRDFDISEMPLARLCPRALKIGIPILVRPRRCAGDIVGRQVVGVAGQQSGDPLANVRKD
jgi:hypothetical protein